MLITRIEKGRQAERVLLLVHGLGTDENDLAAIVPYLDPDGRFLVVLPRGPYTSPPGFSWFPFGPGRRDPDAAANSIAAIDEVLDAACAEHGMPRDQAIIAGFSQGAAMVTTLGYRADTDKPRPAGVIAMSGFLMSAEPLAFSTTGDLPALLVQHGLYDPMVPAHRGRKMAEMLAARGAPVVYREYPMQHQVILESIDDARSWIAAVCSGQRPTTEGASE